MSLEELCHRWLGALFNGLWQGLLLTALVVLALRCVPRVNAATRHAVWFAVLLLVALLPVCHFLLDRSGQSLTETPPVSFAESREGEFRSGLVEEAPDVSLLPTVRREAPETTLRRLPGEFDSTSGRAESFTLAGSRWFEPPVAEAERKPVWSLDSFPVAVLTQPEVSPRDERPWRSALAGLRARWSDWIPANWRFQIPAGLGVVLATSWLGVVLMRLILLGRECLQLKRLKQGSRVASAELQSVFAALGAQMGLRRPAQLFIGPSNSVPMAAGFWRPAVLLPEGFSESASGAQMQQVLRHELGHLIRWDDWACLLQHLLHSFLFFHPAAWWLSRRLTLEREIACDDHVLAALPKPQAYALFLTDFAGRMQRRGIAAAPAAWNRRTQLKERITMILDSKRNSSPRLARLSAGMFITATALLSGWVLQAAPRVALAAGSAEKAVVATAGEAAVTADPFEADAAVASGDPVEVTVETVVAPAVATVITAPHPHPTPRVQVTAPRPAVSLHADIQVPPVHPRLELTVPAAPAVAVVPPAAPVPAPPPLAALPAPPRGPFALMTSERGKATARSSIPPKPDGLTVEQRLERLERMIEELLSRPSASRPDGSPASEWKGADSLFNRDEIAKLSAEAKKVAKETAERMKGEAERMKGELQRQIQEQVRGAKREAERAMRDAERMARDAERAAAAAVAGANETLRKTGPDQQQQIQRQRQTLQAQQKSLEKQMEAIERQLEKLEEAREGLRDQDSDRKDQEEEGPKKKEAF